MPHRRPRVPYLVVPFLLLAVGFASACGDGDDDGTAGPNATATAQRAERLAVPTVSLRDITQVGVALSTSNRDRLAICVQPEEDIAVDFGDSRDAILATLEQLKQHPLYETAGYHLLPDAVVDEGCDAKPVLLGTDVTCLGDKPLGTGDFTESVLRDRPPSPYKIMVFVVSPADITKHFGGCVRRTHFQEMIQDGDTFSSVTTGMYLAADEITYDCVLRREFTHALHLVEAPVGPEPTAVPC